MVKLVWHDVASIYWEIAAVIIAESAEIEECALCPIPLYPEKRRHCPSSDNLSNYLFRLSEGTWCLRVKLLPLGRFYKHLFNCCILTICKMSNLYAAVVINELHRNQTGVIVMICQDRKSERSEKGAEGVDFVFDSNVAGVCFHSINSD